MYCPNCGAVNDPGSKFCANCGTTLGSAAPGAEAPNPPQPPPPVYQPPPNYPAQVSYPSQAQGQIPVAGGNSLAKNIGIGCLIAIAIVLFVGLSCTRACFGLRRSHIIRHY